jgi:hypothetical protein
MLREVKLKQQGMKYTPPQNQNQAEKRSSIYYDHALSGLQTHGFYAPDICHTMYRIAMLKKSTGDAQGAADMEEHAEQLYWEIVKSSKRRVASLSSEDYDNLLAIYAPRRALFDGLKTEDAVLSKFPKSDAEESGSTTLST